MSLIDYRRMVLKTLIETSSFSPTVITSPKRLFTWCYRKPYTISLYNNCIFVVVLGGSPEVITLTSSGSRFDIVSPGYPSDYKNGESVTYLVTAPEGSFIRVAVRDVEIEPVGDSLTFGEGSDPNDASSIIKTIDGFIPPGEFFTENNTLWVTFTTNSHDTFRGFWARLVAVARKSI